MLPRRYALEGDVSGWFVSCPGTDHDHSDDARIFYASPYDLAVEYPEIVGYLALPTDCLVFLGDGPPLIGRGPSVLPFAEGSLLATVFGRQ